MIMISLPLHLKPKFVYDLVRIGSLNDGGYLVEKNSLMYANCLISFGISTNWDFEKQFLSNRKINFRSYDGSINNLFWQEWKKRSLKKCIRFSFKDFFEYYTCEKEFKKFFNYNNFFSKFVGKGDNLVSLSDIFSEISENKVFLKIDIEGSEYDILDDLQLFQDRVIGLIIEFHDCDKKLDKILEFVSRINLKLVHIHGNNYDYVSDKGIPKSLEISFSSKPKIVEDIPIFPHKLDMPNKKKRPELELKFGG